MKSQVKIGRFIFEEVFIFPYEVDRFIAHLTDEFKIDRRKICHVCCGESQIGGLRIDINEKLKPDVVADYKYLPFQNNSQDVVLSDPPWVMKYGETRRFSYHMRDLVKEGGLLIINAPWDCSCKGLELLKVYKVRQAYNSYRHLVDFWIFRKCQLVN